MYNRISHTFYLDDNLLFNIYHGGRFGTVVFDWPIRTVRFYTTLYRFCFVLFHWLASRLERDACIAHSLDERDQRNQWNYHYRWDAANGGRERNGELCDGNVAGNACSFDRHD